MSAPPPGGSPPPQQPPTYPQYPQPPQGYPPQYPPQQPYYPQPTPPPQKSNTALIIVLVVVIVVVVLAVLAWWAVTSLMAPVTSTTSITVTGVSFAINYPGSTEWFGPSPITTCVNCPIKTNSFSQFSYTLTLTNSDTVAHNVTGVTLISTYFTVFSTSPDPSTVSPVVVPAGGSRSIVLTIQGTFGGSYVLTGSVDTD